MRYSFVTVVFETEILLLSLQARSFALFVDPAMVDRIFIIDNSKDGRLDGAIRSLVSDYGPLADKVVVVAAASLMPPMKVDGWLSQQVLKLEIARQIGSERYVVLDSKTHLVAPLERQFLQSPDGRASIHVYSYEKHNLIAYLERTFAFLDVAVAPLLKSLPTSVPPFTIYTQEAVDLMDHVQCVTDRPFHETFIQERLTEFFLYSAWLYKRYGSIETLYSPSQPQSPTLWEKWTYPDKVRAKLTQAETSPFFSIHRRALPKCPKASLRIIESFWFSRGLFASVDDSRLFTKRFIASYRIAFFRERLTRLTKGLRRR